MWSIYLRNYLILGTLQRHTENKYGQSLDRHKQTTILLVHHEMVCHHSCLIMPFRISVFWEQTCKRSPLENTPKQPFCMATFCKFAIKARSYEIINPPSFFYRRSNVIVIKIKGSNKKISTLCTLQFETSSFYHCMIGSRLLIKQNTTQQDCMCCLALDKLTQTILILFRNNCKYMFIGTGKEGVLNQAAVPILHNYWCSRLDWYGASFFSDTSFCAGYISGQQDACTVRKILDLLLISM